MTTAIVSAVASVLTAALVYLGARFTATRSKEAATQATAVDAQESAVQAWQSLLQPYRQEVAQLRQELQDERNDRAAAQKVTSNEVDALRERVGMLNVQLTEWKQMARVISKWAITLRDEVLRLGGTVPATPDELLTLQAIEDVEN